MKVAIVGSRMFSAPKQVKDYIAVLPQDTTVVSGACGEGPDMWAEQEAKRRGLKLILFPVKKDDLPPFPEGRALFAERAYARNILIAEECDAMVGFWDGKSGGTKHAMEAAEKLGKPVTRVTYY